MNAKTDEASTNEPSSKYFRAKELNDALFRLSFPPDFRYQLGEGIAVLRRYTRAIAAPMMRGRMDSHVLDDLTQEVFIMLSRRQESGQLESGMTLRVYIRDAVEHLVKDAARYQSRPHFISHLPAPITDTPKYIELLEVENNRRSVVDAALSSLDPRHRLALELFFPLDGSDKNIDEITKALGMTTRAGAYAIRSRALKQLRESPWAEKLVDMFSDEADDVRANLAQYRLEQRRDTKPN